MSDEFVVGEYRRQKMIADRLRQQADAASSIEAAAPTMSTAASGSFPGMTQVNYAGILQNTLSPWLKNRAYDKADSAQLSAYEAQDRELDSALQNQSAGQMTPQQMMHLKRLGVDTDVMKLMMPKDKSKAPIYQALAQDPGMADLFVGSGDLTQEEADAYKASRATRDAAEFEQQKTLKLLGIKPESTKFDAGSEYNDALLSKDPERIARVEKILNAIKPAGQSAYEKRAEQEQAKLDVATAANAPRVENAQKDIASLIAEIDDGKYKGGTRNQIIDSIGSAAGLTGEYKPSHLFPETRLLLQKSSQAHLNAMDQMRGFGQVTEAEQKIIADTQFNQYDPPEVLREKLLIVQRAVDQGLAKVALAKGRLEGGGVLAPAPQGKFLGFKP